MGLTALAMGQAEAAATLPPVFGNHMVLQRDMPVAVWGEAAPGEEITVSFRSQKKSTRADLEGKWRLDLDALEAGGPDALVVAASNTVTLEDVLVGEVWLGSGQSNMDYTPKSGIFPDDQQLAEIVKKAPYPQIRLLHSDGAWTLATPENVENFSALLMAFGQALQPEVGVPVGLIQAARGSTPSGVWLTKEMLAADAACQAQVEAFKAKNPPEVLEAEFQKSLGLWREQVEKQKAAGKSPPPEPVRVVAGDFSSRKIHQIFDVGVCYRERVEPLAPYTVRGILWDQGESRTGLAELDQAAVMGALIRGWREAWGRRDLPFFYLQKPSGAGAAWAYDDPVTSMARPFVALTPEVKPPLLPAVPDPYFQMMEIPNAWMVPSSDLGPGLHPMNKSGYGKRASDVVRNRIYGHPTPAAGPIVDACTIEGNKVRVRFKNASDGLDVRHRGKIQGFVLVDATARKPVWADAEIEGDSVIVSSPDVAVPATVAYAWAKEYPWANLFGKNHLPALPFRQELSDTRPDVPPK